MIVIVDVPVVAVVLAVKVRTLVEVVGLVPNEAVTPEGRAEFESVTLPVNPPLGVTVIVSCRWFPVLRSSCWAKLTARSSASPWH